MALNLGAPAYDAIQSLKNSREWQLFKAGMQEAFERQLHQALDTDPERRQDATGYCRALRDVIVTIELNEMGAGGNRNFKPPVKAARNA